jgi:hypothetical protein
VGSTRAKISRDPGSDSGDRSTMAASFAFVAAPTSLVSSLSNFSDSL